MALDIAVGNIALRFASASFMSSYSVARIEIGDVKEVKAHICNVLVYPSVPTARLSRWAKATVFRVVDTMEEAVAIQKAADDLRERYQALKAKLYRGCDEMISDIAMTGKPKDASLYDIEVEWHPILTDFARRFLVGETK